ncbi:MAG: hypothetical protein HETSPECPRED_008678 [Heterodermia speciosa]|uniref:Orc1-like AAA ATPase domain-containing protein n=1 Tax=Heterodermia speciosa TaxID=116794 RepID=A0A8H3G2R6_9LECA|nr:MAG: hypothetical protein HETSPECPRED_008678 [Heterodermia speciosa]
MDLNLPEELVLALKDIIPGREPQIRQLTSLLSPVSGPSTLVVHGTEATGKSTTTKAVLKFLENPFAIIRSQECVTTRHLLERTIAAVNKAGIDEKAGDGALYAANGRCESISAFIVLLQKTLPSVGKFTLVFDGIDRQRDASPTLLPAIARLGELITNLSVILIVTVPQPRLLHRPGIPHIRFPPYTKAEALQIVSLSPLVLCPSSPSDLIPNMPKDEDSQWLWSRFCGAVWDSLGQGAARDITSFRSVCSQLWKPFTEPILKGDYGVREFAKLMVRNRALFQSEAALTKSIITPNTSPTSSKSAVVKALLALPFYSAYLLVAAYLASYNPPRLDQTFFTKTSERRKRRRAPPSTPNHRKIKNRKINRRLLGPQAFVLERWLAIFSAIVPDGGVKGGGADVMGQIATLGRLGLVTRAGTGDGEMGGEKWRANVGWEVVRGLGRAVGCEVENYLAE